MNYPPYEVTIEGRKYRIKQKKQYYMQEEDLPILGKIRSCASTNISPNTRGCPAVWTLDEPRLKTQITKYWQIYICVMNYKMNPKQVLAELDYTRALANGTGYGKDGDPRRNYITGENLNSTKDPAFDKDRTMSRAMLMSADGIEYDAPLLFKDYRSPKGDNKLYDGYIILKMFDGNMPPPMKPGKRQPERLADARFDDYLYNTRDDWEMFFALNIINTSGLLIPFDGGAYYDWYFNSKVPVCFYPHVAREQIKYPIDLLKKLPLGTKRIVPYTKGDYPSFQVYG